VEHREPHPISFAERDRQGRLLAVSIERAAMRTLAQLSVEDETLTGAHASALLISVLVLQASNVAVQSELALEALQESVRRAYEGVRSVQHEDRPMPGPA
jgi:hypothetical protein